jgi:2-dehydro-3-deoxygluconokinase
VTTTTDKPKRIVSIGECMIELSQVPELGASLLRLAFAGDTLNTAIYLARALRHQPGGGGWRVGYVTRLGSDEMSERMLEEWRREDLQTDLVEREADALPGLYLIQTDAAGERRFSYWRSQSPARRLFAGPGPPEILDRLADCDAIYFTGITLAILAPEGRERLIALSREIVRHGGLVAFDGNFRPALWRDAREAADWLRKAYALAGIALPGADEAALFGCPDAGALAGLLLEQGAREVVVKQGADACIVACAGENLSVPCPPVSRIVDATAAGDSFNAGYLAARMTGAPVEAAARLGHRLAGQVVGEHGAILPPERVSIPPWQNLA